MNGVSFQKELDFINFEMSNYRFVEKESLEFKLLFILDFILYKLLQVRTKKERIFYREIYQLSKNHYLTMGRWKK